MDEQKLSREEQMQEKGRQKLTGWKQIKVTHRQKPDMEDGQKGLLNT